MRCFFGICFGPWELVDRESGGDIAPGGDLDTDENGDGYPDGILAETIAYQDPSSTGYWFYAGTSQATAVASGAAALLIADGASRDDVHTALQLGAKGIGSEIEDGLGTGSLDLDKSAKNYEQGKTEVLPERYVAMMPYLGDGGDELEPMVLVTLLDGDAQPVGGAEVFGVFVDQDGNVQAFDCGTSSDGQCTGKIDKVDRYDPSTGEELAWAWSVRVPTVYEDKVSSHPGSAFFLTDGLEILLAALDYEGTGIATSPLGVKWGPGHDYHGVGEVAESYVFPNLGTGIATSPLGVIATPPFIEPHATMDTIDVDLDGTGIATSPLGVVQLPRLIFDGTGIATSPLGLQPITIIPVGGVGIATSPLGFTPPDLLDPTAPGFDDPSLFFENDPVLLGTGIATSPLGVLGGTHAGDLLDAGGWAVTEGYGAGTALQGSGMADFEYSTGSETAQASCVGSQPLE